MTKSEKVISVGLFKSEVMNCSYGVQSMKLSYANWMQ